VPTAPPIPTHRAAARLWQETPLRWPLHRAGRAYATTAISMVLADCVIAGEHPLVPQGRRPRSDTRSRCRQCSNRATGCYLLAAAISVPSEKRAIAGESDANGIAAVEGADQPVTLVPPVQHRGAQPPTHRRWRQCRRTGVPEVTRPMSSSCHGDSRAAPRSQ